MKITKNWKISIDVNNEIARYLERKFAFMQDEMVYYKLKCEVNGGTVGKTTITLRTIPYLIAAGE